MGVDKRCLIASGKSKLTFAGHKSQSQALSACKFHDD